MIDVKIISKPKSNGTGGGSTGITAGTPAYSNLAAKEAAHAAKADLAKKAEEAEHAKLADEATHAVEASHALLADSAGASDHAKEADHALEADNADKWDGAEKSDYIDQPVKTTDRVSFAEVVSNLLRNIGSFVPGLLGSGFGLRMEDGIAKLDVDQLTVRQAMRVMELIIEKVRSVGGELVATAANGKVATVTDGDDSWLLTFEEGGGDFVEGDYMRCQVFTLTHRKSYWVRVAYVSGGTVAVLKSDSGWQGSLPEVGDEVVLMGSDVKDRQGAVVISATDDGTPRVDVLGGLDGRSTAGKLRARLGRLDGIRDDNYPVDGQPQGYGLYSDNAYLRGTFLLRTGQDINTWVEVTEGRVRSVVDSLRNDLVGGRGMLSNTLFAEGLKQWAASGKARFYKLGSRWIWAKDMPYSQKNKAAGVTEDEGRTVVRLNGGSVVQKNADFAVHPTFEKDANGATIPQKVRLSFYYKVVKAGRLTGGLVDGNTKVGYEPLTIDMQMGVTTGYQRFDAVGMWDGSGDFRLNFSGEMCLYMLVLDQDGVDVLEARYRTLFEQSDRLIRLTAGIYDHDEKALRESGLLIRPEGSGIYAQTADGKLALIGVATQKDGKTLIQLTADNIRLEGIVTANGNFKVLADGSIEAKNGTFTGKVNASEGKIAGFTISGSGLTNRGEDGKFSNDAYIIFRNDAHGCFAGIGGNVLPSSSGVRGVARFENEDESDQWGLGRNYGIIASAKGSDTNIALAILGGCISGLAVRTQAISSSQAIGRDVVSVACLNKEEITLTLPEMQPYDDGHVVKIKNLNGSKVNIKPGKCWVKEYNDSTMRMELKQYNTYIHADRGEHFTVDKPDDLEASGDATEYVFHRDLLNSDGTLRGCWVQYKHPRDW